MADALTFDDLIPSRGMPEAGYLPGQVHLDPKLAPDVADGEPRPFAPGEYVSNPDGSWSSEISMSVAHPSLNGGKPTNIPSLWVVGGKAYRAKNEDEAATLAAQSGLTWPSYPDMAAADKAATEREAKWQGVAPQHASAIAPLWTAGPLSPEAQFYKSRNPGITDDQARYAVANAKLRDAAAPEGDDPTNPAYDRPGKTGNDTLYRVDPQGRLNVPYFDDLIPHETPVGDAVKSAEGGLIKGAAGTLDMLGPAIGLGPLETLTRAARTVGGADPAHSGGHFVESVVDSLMPEARYVPQTTAGRYLHTAGAFAPAAFLGEGGVASRAANALLPAIGSQFAGDAAHDMGAPPWAEGAARLAGGLAGGAGASLRLNPAALAQPADRAAPTLDQLTTAKNAAYKAVDNADVRFTPKAFNGLLSDMAQRMDDAGFMAGNHPKAANMLAAIGASARGQKPFAPTLGEVDKLRQQIGRDVASSSDAGDRRMGAIMRSAIDDFVNGATADAVKSKVDPSQASALLNTARDLNTRVEKLKALDNLDEAAQDRAAATGVGANAENATRQNVIRFKNQVDNLTPDEQAAVQQAIRGTFSQNALRGLGALSPDRGAIGSMVNLGAAVASHGTSVPLSIGAILARRAAASREEANVQNLRDIIAAGGKKIDVGAPDNALAPRRFIQLQPGDDQLVPAVLFSGRSATPEQRTR